MDIPSAYRAIKIEIDATLVDVDLDNESYVGLTYEIKPHLGFEPMRGQVRIDRPAFQQMTLDDVSELISSAFLGDIGQALEETFCPMKLWTDGSDIYVARTATHAHQLQSIDIGDEARSASDWNEVVSPDPLEIYVEGEGTVAKPLAEWIASEPDGGRLAGRAG